MMGMDFTGAVAMCLLLVIGAYVCGSAPFGLLVGLANGVDVRKIGSGNIGATNVGRTLGRKFGILVFILDVLKGLVPMLIAGPVLGDLAVSHEWPMSLRYWLWIAVGLAAVIGHTNSLFLRFRGGKGVSTALGITLGMYPAMTLPALGAFAIWIIVVATTRIMSLAALIASAMLPLLFLAANRWRQHDLAETWPVACLSLAIAVIVIVRHRSNIGRIIAGVEPRIGAGGPTQATPASAETARVDGIDAEFRE